MNSGAGSPSHQAFLFRSPVWSLRGDSGRHSAWRQLGPLGLTWHGAFPDESQSRELTRASTVWDEAARTKMEQRKEMERQHRTSRSRVRSVAQFGVAPSLLSWFCIVSLWKKVTTNWTKRRKMPCMVGCSVAWVVRLANKQVQVEQQLMEGKTILT